MTHLSHSDWLAWDEDHRQQALDVQQSFIVQAPAGAGKTELLTQRFLTLLKTVDHPEEIVALTFTNKAAAEMRKRIMDSLLHASQGKECPPQPHKRITHQLSLDVLARDRQKGWGLLQHTGRLHVTTLDALCARLARQMPILSRFGSQPAVTTDAEPFYQQAARLTLSKLNAHTDDAANVASAVQSALSHFENDRQRLEGLLVAMLASRDQWLTYAVDHTETLSRAHAQAALTAMVRLELESLSSLLPVAEQLSIMAAARFAGSQAIAALQSGKKAPPGLQVLESWQQPLRCTEDDLPLWQGVADLLLTGKSEVRSGPPNNVGLTASSAEGKAHKETLQQFLDAFRSHPKASQLARVRTLTQPIYDDNEWALINSLVTILKDASAELWLAFQEAGQVDFIEITQNALRALGTPNEPTDLALQLDYQIRHLLIDEFQDTSPVQVELLTQLTSGWQAQDGRTLFLVGDPMQSIYRFRKADVGLFLHVQENGVGQVHLQRLQLYRNNRSDPALVSWVNSTFARVFSDPVDARVGSVGFEPAAATREPMTDAGMQMHAVVHASANDEDSEGDDRGLREAQRVMDIIRETWSQDRQRSIAILVRARGHLTSIVSALRKTAPDLPIQAVEIEALGQRQCILDLVSLTRALHHRADRVHWLAVLRAPWCGLLIEDLHRLAHDDHSSTLWQLMNQANRVAQLSPDGQQRLAHVRAVMQEAMLGQGRMRVRQWVEGVWQGLGGPYTLKSERDLLDVRAYFDLLDACDVGGRLDLQALDRQLDRLFAASDAHAATPIQIMTIHKSKGLEFDTVILPGLHRQPRNDDQPLMIWDKILLEDGQEHLAAGVMRAGDDQDDETARPYDLLQTYEKSRAANEAKRLLYVAVTRAIRKLHLVAVVNTNTNDPNEPAIKPPAQGSLLKLLWPLLEEMGEPAMQTGLQPPVASTDLGVRNTPDFKPWLVRLRKVCWPEQWANNVPTPVQDETTRLAKPEPTAYPASNPWAIDVGILTHRYLEIMATQGLEVWPEHRLIAAQAQQELWFKRKGYDPSTCREASLAVQQNLLRTLRSERGRWILSPHENAASEYPLTTQVEGQMRQHVIDRTFIHEGVRWIIDYKTSTASEIPNDTFFAEKLDVYRDQLLRYMNLFESDGIPVRAALYFPGLDRWVELND